MKKIIIAAAIVLTTGVLTVVTKDNSIKTVKSATTAIAIDKNILATAD
ncbi:MAG TPA: hypothetical protein VGC01_12445 [Mucilaginibacter sp.]